MQGVKYSVDLALCIDVTGSMQDIIGKAKANALNFYEDLTREMSEKGKLIDQLRVKVIAFRDYYVDGDASMNESPFFILPKEREGFSSFVNALRADGGGPTPESGLEALALAIRSDWSKASGKKRQVIVMWTDAETHKLEKNASAKPAGYPQDLPQDFDELTDWWEGQTYMSATAKRLVIYAPDSYAWTDIANYWSNVIHYPSRAGDGLEEVDYGTIIDSIAKSV